MIDIVQELRSIQTTCPSLHRTFNSAASEIERLRAALQKIANPIGYLQEYAKQEGRQLDGHVAVQISKDAGWLKSEAAKALSIDAVGSPPTPSAPDASTRGQ